MKLKLKHRRKVQPMKTMCVDLDEGVENEICNDDCPHIHTTWSKAHVARHLGNVSERDRADGFAKRVHIATKAKLTIMSLESTHAQFRRRIKSRGVQTHGVDFQELNSMWCADRTAKREESIAWGQVAKECDPPQATLTLADSPEHEEISDSTKGGGLWRAFIRDRSFGQQGRPDFTELATQYKTVSPADVERLMPGAAAAKGRARNGVRQGQ